MKKLFASAIGRQNEKSSQRAVLAGIRAALVLPHHTPDDADDLGVGSVNGFIEAMICPEPATKPS